MRFKQYAAIVLLVAPTLMTCPLVSGAELSGVKFPDQIKVAGKTLQLNGLGLREATIFKVDVYVGALYLQQSKSKDPNAILNSKDLKRVVLHFVHDAPADKIRDAWREGLENNCKTSCDQYKPLIEKLGSWMVDMKDGDEMTFTFFPGRVDVNVKGHPKGSLSASGFSSVLLADWLGPNPPNSSLKEGMLGLRKD